MAYTPIDPLGLRHGLAGNSSLYETLWDNHIQIYESGGPGIADWFFSETISDGITNTLIFTWRVRGNLDQQVVRTRVYAESTGGTTTVYVSSGGVTASQSVTVAGWYTLNVTPPVTGVAVFEMRVTIPVAAVFTLTRIQSRLVEDSPAAGQRPSRYTRADSADIFAADEPVTSERMGRLLAGPVRIAQSHPRCVASHIVRTNLSGGAKSTGKWQGYNSTSWQTVGFLTIPRVSMRARRYVLDAFTMETTTDGSSADIVIGGIEWSLRNLGGTSGKWHSIEIELAPGPHEIRVAALPGASNYIRIPTFQAWRGKAVYP